MATNDLILSEFFRKGRLGGSRKGTLNYNGSILYSYGMPICALGGNRAYFTADPMPSVTSKRHYNAALREACKYGWEVITGGAVVSALLYDKVLPLAKPKRVAKLQYTPTAYDAALLEDIREALVNLGPNTSKNHRERAEYVAGTTRMVQLGRGAFGFALAHPTDSRLCFKVVTPGACDYHFMDPWATFAGLCLRDPKNPTLPGVYALHVHAVGIVALMERFDSNEDDLVHHANLADRFIRGFEEIDSALSISKASKARLTALGKTLKKMCPNSSIDIHSGNIRLRGSEIVIIDPLCYGMDKSSTLKALHECPNTVITAQED